MNTTLKHSFAALVLIASAVGAHAETKKELVQKILQLQRPGIEQMAAQLAQQPAVQMAQQASMGLGSLPPEKREPLAKLIQAEAKKYSDAAVPLIQDRAVKIAPTTVGAALEKNFTEDELKQLIAWFQSPVNKKFGDLAPEMNQALVKQLVDEGKPLVDPKLKTMETNIRAAIEKAVGAPKPAGSNPNAGKKK